MSWATGQSATAKRPISRCRENTSKSAAAPRQTGGAFIEPKETSDRRNPNSVPSSLLPGNSTENRRIHETRPQRIMVVKQSAGNLSCGVEARNSVSTHTDYLGFSIDAHASKGEGNPTYSGKCHKLGRVKS